jgi:hypothetical protein
VEQEGGNTLLKNVDIKVLYVLKETTVSLHKHKEEDHNNRRQCEGIEKICIGLFSICYMVDFYHVLR